MVAIPPLVDSRGYKLVADLPRSNDFANALQGMVQRGAAKDKAYEDKQTMRQAGMLAQLSRIGDDEQYASYLQNAITNAADDEERGELQQLSQYDRATGQQIASGMVRQVGLGSMLASESSAQRKSWKLNTRPIPTGETNEKGEPLYDLRAGSNTLNPDGSNNLSQTNIMTGVTLAEINADSNSKGYEFEAGKIKARQDAADQDAKDAANKAREVEGAKQSIRFSTEPEIQASIALARSEASAQGTELNLLADMTASMPSMLAMVDDLKELNKEATSTTTGRVIDFLAGEANFATDGATAAEKYKSIVSNNILPLLRQTFGSAFTAEEGQRLIDTLGDLNRPAKIRSQALDSFITAKTRYIETLERRTNKINAPITAKPSANPNAPTRSKFIIKKVEG